MDKITRGFSLFTDEKGNVVTVLRDEAKHEPAIYDFGSEPDARSISVYTPLSPEG